MLVRRFCEDKNINNSPFMNEKIITCARTIYIETANITSTLEEHNSIFDDIRQDVTIINKVFIKGIPYIPNVEGIFDKNKSIDQEYTRSFVKTIITGYISSNKFKTMLTLEELTNLDNVVFDLENIIISGYVESCEDLVDKKYIEFNTTVINFYENHIVSLNDSKDGNNNLNVIVYDPLEYVPNFCKDISSLSTDSFVKKRLLNDFLDDQTKIKFVSRIGEKPTFNFMDVSENSLIIPNKIYNVGGGKSSGEFMIDLYMDSKEIHNVLFKDEIRSLFDNFVLIYDSSLGMNIRKIIVPTPNMNSNKTKLDIKNIIRDFRSFSHYLYDKYKTEMRIIYNSSDRLNKSVIIFRNSNFPLNNIEYIMNKREILENFIIRATTEANDTSNSIIIKTKNFKEV